MLLIGFVFVSLVVIFPVILFFVKQYPMISELQDLLDSPFVCPNCGHQFTLKMYQVWYKLPSFYVLNGLRIKCPKCRETHVCSHSHE